MRYALVALSLGSLVGCGSAAVVEPAEPTVAALPATTEERVARIRALQEGLTDAAEEAEIVRIFEAVRGEDLTALKEALDRDSYRNVLHLVQSDLDDVELQLKLVAHLATATAGGARKVRVLSDIDDTIYCSLNDPRFESGQRYPGVGALYDALGDGVTFVSARPGDRAGAVVEATLAQIAGFGFTGVAMLPGSFDAVADHDAMAARKVANFEQYKALYPEYDFVFVGDSGQGDAAFGRAILEAHRAVVKAVFIHDLSNPHPVPEGDGLHYVPSYAHAANLARDLGLIDPAAAEAVVAAAKADLDALTWTDEALKSARVADFAALLAPKP